MDRRGRRSLRKFATLNDNLCYPKHSPAGRGDRRSGGWGEKYYNHLKMLSSSDLASLGHLLRWRRLIPLNDNLPPQAFP